MVVTEIKYGKTFNKGDYNSERIDMTAMLSDGECAVLAIASLRAVVEGVPLKANTGGVVVSELAVISQSSNEVDETVEIESVDPKKKRGRQRGTSKIGDKVLTDDEAKVAIEEKMQAIVVAEAVKTNPKFKTMGAPYNRELDLHKKLVGDFLNREFPQWKANPKQAKEASLAVSGIPFLDSDGIVLESFKTTFREKMA